MNRNHRDDQWRQCHWREWREIKIRRNKLHKAWEENSQQSRVTEAERESEFERLHQRSDLNRTRRKPRFRDLRI
jgi:hypothetical protein